MSKSVVGYLGNFVEFDSIDALPELWLYRSMAEERREYMRRGQTYTAKKIYGKYLGGINLELRRQIVARCNMLTMLFQLRPILENYHDIRLAFSE